MSAVLEEVDLESLLGDHLPCEVFACVESGNPEEADSRSSLTCPECSHVKIRLAGPSCRAQIEQAVAAKMLTACEACAQLVPLRLIKFVAI